jgi:hypothetical protein
MSYVLIKKDFTSQSQQTRFGRGKMSCISLTITPKATKKNWTTAVQLKYTNIRSAAKEVSRIVVCVLSVMSVVLHQAIAARDSCIFTTISIPTGTEGQINILFIQAYNTDSHFTGCCLFF